MPEVAHVFLCFVHRFPMQEVEDAELIENKGLRGCIHGRTGSKRQVLLMDAETLGRFGLPPGVTKENITTQGIDFQTLGEGQRIRLGASVLEITGPCHPCDRMDEIRMGLQQELRGQRGWLCKVLEGGRIQRGDRIEVLAAVAKAAP